MLIVRDYYIISTSGWICLKDTFKWKIVQVKDGDIVVVSPAEGSAFFTCRLYGIDAHETSKRGKAGATVWREGCQRIQASHLEANS